MESVLLLRRRKGIDGLEISRSAARRATDALRRHLAHGFDALLPERRRDLPFSLNVLGMGFDTAQMEKADLVHLHWIGGRTVDFTRLSHIRRPLVYTLHDMFACTAGCHCTMDCDRFRDECRGSCPQLGTPRLFRGLPAWLFSRKRRSFARIPSLTLVTPSLWLKREVEKGCMFPGRRIVQIYNPVDTDLFRPAEDREAIRAALGIPSGAFVLPAAQPACSIRSREAISSPWCWRNCTGAGTGTFICCSSATRKRTWNSPSPAQMPASLRT